eukprot:scaffold756_cov158-Amphora_coffeaeformis.AAC.7
MASLYYGSFIRHLKEVLTEKRDHDVPDLQPTVFSRVSVSRGVIRKKSNQTCESNMLRQSCRMVNEKSCPDWADADFCWTDEADDRHGKRCCVTRPQRLLQIIHSSYQERITLTFEFHYVTMTQQNHAYHWIDFRKHIQSKWA